jgi:hypothetical protein
MERLRNPEQLRADVKARQRGRFSFQRNLVSDRRRSRNPSLCVRPSTPVSPLTRLKPTRIA